MLYAHKQLNYTRETLLELTDEKRQLESRVQRLESVLNKPLSVPNFNDILSLKKLKIESYAYKLEARQANENMKLLKKSVFRKLYNMDYNNKLLLEKCSKDLEIIDSIY